MSEQVPTITNPTARSLAYSDDVLSAPVSSDAGRESCDDIITHATLLRSHADCVMAASIALVHHSFVMLGRASASVEVSFEIYEKLLAVADRLSASLKRATQSRVTDAQQSLTKAADDHDAIATLMDAGAAMSADMHANVHFVLASLSALGKLALSVDGDSERLCVPLSTLSPSALTSLSTVWRELPDSTVSTVSGRGMKIFMKGAAGATRNVVLVYPRVSSGALAEYVKPEDVSLILKDEAGSLIDGRVTVDGGADDGLQIAYVVADDSVSKLRVSMSVCGVVSCHNVIVKSAYDAIHGSNSVASYSVGTHYKSGLAVNADGSLMAVSHKVKCQVRVFRLAPSFERVCVIGRNGTGPAEFKDPLQICFTSADTVLVCDKDNNRVQQLSAIGEYMSSFAVQKPMSIAVHGDIVAVGSDGRPVELHSLATCGLIRRFESHGDGPGQIGYYATGIRFTPNGACLLVAEISNHPLSLLTVFGVLIKHIGVDVLADGPKDVSFGAGGEIIVAECDRDRISIFSPDGSTRIKTWGARGTAAGKFVNPRALAVSGPYLYVMDATRRVQAFE